MIKWFPVILYTFLDSLLLGMFEEGRERRIMQTVYYPPSNFTEVALGLPRELENYGQSLHEQRPLYKDGKSIGTVGIKIF